MPKMITVQKCCFSVDLKVGAYLIFIYMTVSYVLSVLGLFIPSINLITLRIDSVAGKVFYVILCLVGFGCCLCAIHGLYRNKGHKYLQPWLGFILFSVFFTFLVILGLIFGFFRFEVVTLLINIISIVLLSYFWVCVYSLYIIMASTPDTKSDITQEA